MKWVKGLNCMMIDGNKTYGAGSFCHVYKYQIKMLNTCNLYNVTYQFYLNFLKIHFSTKAVSRSWHLMEFLSFCKSHKELLLPTAHTQKLLFLYY